MQGWASRPCGAEQWDGLPREQENGPLEHLAVRSCLLSLAKARAEIDAQGGFTEEWGNAAGKGSTGLLSAGPQLKFGFSSLQN